MIFYFDEGHVRTRTFSHWPVILNVQVKSHAGLCVKKSTQ
jgi:hypothetical protein